MTKFGFKQPTLDIEYNQSEEKFISKSTKIFIKTDIPVGFSAGFEITPTVLESSCTDVDGSIDVEGFATYYMGGKFYFSKSQLFLILLIILVLSF
ncbi:hypothetical protein FM037_03960 [Shewanella psychropiezotolerans]|uniref:Uncharacterized protein n=1 Tax=Shewanella psychropiezotolerans TaxID=2593655 RepID=A0ABX5WUS0_9GAMM|nr:hypothetical protein [Shewanella psychropiezotolerans]QDO82546.1 hypothetical protein FM037_03960 [Shewanella psychropiezotolerans]